jgi:cytochrome c-type biogenesis protein CcmE
MSRKLLLGTVLAAAGILAWFVTSKPNRVYVRSVSKFVAQPILDEVVRVDGRLVHGSVCKRTAPCEYRFRMRDAWSGPPAFGAELSVRYRSCIVPDAFRDTPGSDLLLSVEGEQCASCHGFEATMILARDYNRGYRLRSVGPPPPPALDVPPCAKL